MAKSLMDWVLDKIFDSGWLGRRGEKLTERKLKRLSLSGQKGKILRNVYVPKDNGETSEIDLIFITCKGIFVIESKNYSGWIYGDEKSLQWTQAFSQREKIHFYNPVKQNRTHMKWLREYLADSTPLFSLVVFSERCELKKIVVESPDVNVIKRDQLCKTVRAIWEDREDALSKEQVKDIYVRLRALTHVSKAVKKAHIAAIREKYESGVFAEMAAAMEETAVTVSDFEEDAVLAAPRCPVCGGVLVLRMAKKGANAGSTFYGCSNFPKCRYTQNV